MKRNFLKVLIIFAVLLIVSIVLSGYMLLSTDKILSNVYINDIDVGGLSREEAFSKIKEIYEGVLKNTYLTLVYEDKDWKLAYNDIDYSYNYENAIDEAYRIGRTGNIISRYIVSIKSKFRISEIPLGFSYNEDNIIKKLDNISASINRSSADATIRLKSGKFEITPETIGLKLDNSKALAIVKSSIENNEISTIELPVEIMEPEIKKSDLSSINDKLGEYTTRFDATNTNRTFNIALATKSVTDVLINPGEVFSLYKVIGSRLEEQGYRMAKVIINNEYVDGIGGGLCQISTTLYNAALLSNMKIIERKNHSLPSEYVGLGRDATISGDYIDMKFENNTATPIYIYGEVKGNRVTFSIYGKKENPNRTVEIRTSVIKKIEPQVKIIHDETLPFGQEVIEKKAIAGYVVKSYRVVLENGKEVFIEPLYTDTYKVSDEVKRVGTKSVDTLGEEDDLSSDNLDSYEGFEVLEDFYF